MIGFSFFCVSSRRVSDSREPVEGAQRLRGDQLPVQHGHVQPQREETPAEGQQVGRADAAPQTGHDDRDQDGPVSEIADRHFRTGEKKTAASTECSRNESPGLRIAVTKITRY